MQVADPLFPFRFAHHLPWASKIILNPALSFVACGFAALAGSIFSIHYALSFMILWTAIFAFYLERGLLERVLIPPFALIMAWEAVGLGVGIGLITYGSNNQTHPQLLKMQMAHLILFPIICAAYRFGFGKQVRMTFPDYSPSFHHSVVRPLIVIGWMLFLWRILQLTVFAATGAEDRGDFSLVANNQVFGIWTYFSLFNRFNSLGFFILPLIFARASAPLRMVLIGLLCYFFLLAFSSGGRGNVFYPVLYIGIGAFFFRLVRFIKLDSLGVIVIIAIMPVVVLMDHFRNTEAYRASRTIDIGARLGAISEAKTRSGEVKDTSSQRENYLIMGRALVGVSDDVIYEMTPSVIPHARTKDLHAVIYTWIPFFIKRDRPVLQDTNIFIIEYLGQYWTNTGRAVSLTADSYRRFGWAGVPIIMAIAFCLYGFFARTIYNIYLKTDALFGILLILLTFSFFQARPFGTVLTTWWNFLYDVPKHIAGLIIIYFVVKSICKLGSIPGAIALGAPHMQKLPLHGRKSSRKSKPTPNPET